MLICLIWPAQMLLFQLVPLYYLTPINLLELYTNLIPFPDSSISTFQFPQLTPEFGFLITPFLHFYVLLKYQFNLIFPTFFLLSTGFHTPFDFPEVVNSS